MYSSDDEDTTTMGTSSYGRRSSLSSQQVVSFPNQENEAVYRVLRDACDELILELDSDVIAPVYVRRGGGDEDEEHNEDDVELKPGFFVGTKYNLYLFKLKHHKLYCCWPLNNVKVVAGTNIMSVMPLSSTTASDFEDCFDVQSSSPSAIDRLSTALTSLIYKSSAWMATAGSNSQTATTASTKALLAAYGITKSCLSTAASRGRRDSHRRVQLMTGENDDEDQPANNTSSDDDEDDHDTKDGEDERRHPRGGGPLQHKKSVIGMKSGGKAFGGKGGSEPNSPMGGGDGASSAKFNPLASLIDGEFTSDFSAVRNAYIQNQHEDLVTQMRGLITNNEHVISKLCSEHYNAFLMAASRCNSIDSNDAAAVRSDISGACRHIKISVHDMKTAGTNVMRSVDMCANVTMGKQLLAECLLCAEKLEELEDLVERRKLVVAVAAMRSLQYAVCRNSRLTADGTVAAAAGNGGAAGDGAVESVAASPSPNRGGVNLTNTTHQQLDQGTEGATSVMKTQQRVSVAHTDLGNYILYERMPKLRAAIMDSAMAQANDWLMIVREAAFRVGSTAMSFCANSRHDQKAEKIHREKRLSAAEKWRLEALVQWGRRCVVFGPAVDEWCVATIDAATSEQMAQRNEDDDDDDESMDPAEHKKRSDRLSGRGLLGGANLNTTLNTAFESHSDLFVRIAGGAAIREVFQACSQTDVFREYYLTSRKRQFEVDVKERSKSLTAAAAATGSTASVQAGNHQDVFTVSLGFILVEDIVHQVTTLSPPALHSNAQLLTLWELVSNTVYEHCQLIAENPANLGGGGDPEEILIRTIEKLHHFINVVTCQLKDSVEFNVAQLASMLEVLVNRLHSQWTQECCGMVTHHLMADPMSPLKCTTQTEYHQFVGRFHLHRLTALAIPAFHSDAIYLPFSESVPHVGDSILEFFDRCVSIVPDCHGFGALIAKHNNHATMLLEYLVVIFRTVGGMMNAKLQSLAGARTSSVFQYAVCAAHATALRGIASLLEQKFAVYWDGRYASTSSKGNGSGTSQNAKQKVGSPQLLSDADKQLRQIHSQATEACNTNLIAHVDELLTPMRELEYWTDFDKGKRDSCLAEALTYTMATVPKLSVAFGDSTVEGILSTIVMRVAEAIENHIRYCVQKSKVTKTVDSLRKAVAKFDSTTKPAIENWMMQLHAISAANPNSSIATLTFPVDFDTTVTDLYTMIDDRELILAAEAAEQLKLMAGVEFMVDVSKATVKGVGDVSKATVKGVAGAGKATVKGVAGAGKATKRGFFRFGRSVKDGLHIGKHGEEGVDYEAAMHSGDDVVQDGENGIHHQHVNGNEDGGDEDGHPPQTRDAVEEQPQQLNGVRPTTPPPVPFIVRNGKDVVNGDSNSDDDSSDSSSEESSSTTSSSDDDEPPAKQPPTSSSSPIAKNGASLSSRTSETRAARRSAAREMQKPPPPTSSVSSQPMSLGTRGQRTRPPKLDVDEANKAGNIAPRSTTTPASSTTSTAIAPPSTTSTRGPIGGGAASFNNTPNTTPRGAANGDGGPPSSYYGAPPTSAAPPMYGVPAASAPPPAPAPSQVHADPAATNGADSAPPPEEKKKRRFFWSRSK